MTTPLFLKKEQGLPPTVSRLLKEGDFEGLARALDNGLPANLEDASGVPLLEHVLDAIESRHRKGYQVDVPSIPESLVDAFIRNGLERGTTRGGVATHVSMASNYGQWDLVMRLLKEGFQVEAPGQSALVSMTEGRLVRALLKGVDEGDAPQEQEPQSTAPDPLTSANVHAFPSRRAAPGASPGADKAGVIIQDAPSEQGRINQVVQALVEAGASLDVGVPVQSERGQSRAGFTPLMCAIFRLDGAMVEAMVRAGADLTHRPDGFPYRPLELAITRGSTALVESLIAAGAPLTPDPSHEGQAQHLAHPLMLCVRMGLPHLIETIAQAMPEDDRKKYGLMAMHTAAAQGDVACMRAVRLQGIAYNAPTEQNGFQPIHQAAFAGQEDVLSFLLRRGEKWDAASHSGLTAKDILSSHHPHLLERFGMGLPTNVRTLFGRGRKP